MDIIKIHSKYIEFKTENTTHIKINIYYNKNRKAYYITANKIKQEIKDNIIIESFSPYNSYNLNLDNVNRKNKSKEEIYIKSLENEDFINTIINFFKTTNDKH